MFFLILLLIAVVGFIVFFIFAQIEGNKDEKRTDEVFDVFKEKHSSAVSYRFTYDGFCAFSDEKRVFYFYDGSKPNCSEYKYDSILNWKENKDYEIWINKSKPGDYKVLKMHITENLNAIRTKINIIIKGNNDIARYEYSKLVSLPKDTARVNVRKFSGRNIGLPAFFDKYYGSTHLWKEGNDICLLPVYTNIVNFRCWRHEYQVVKIDKKTVSSLSQEGSVHYTTEVSGGGGGGSSLAGAVVGGVIAGGAGAIIGSRKKLDPVTSTTKQIDDRITSLKLLDEDNNFSEIIFDYNDYYVLSKLLNE